MEGSVVRSFNLLIFSGTFRLLRLVHNRAKQRINTRAKDREYDNRVTVAEQAQLHVASSKVNIVFHNAIVFLFRGQAGQG